MIEHNKFDHSLHQTLVPWIVASALFMEMTDATILSNAIPVIASHLHESPLNLKVALTSYLVSLGILIPISGWIADKYGTRETLLFGVTVFGLGSFSCGMSESLQGLVIARIVQGAGGALMTPVCRLILVKSYPKSELVKMNNYATTPPLLGPALGPVIGGIIVTYFSWRWIFFVNIPFCFILLYLVYFHTNSFKEKNVRKFDLLGFIFFSISLSLAIFTIEASGENFLTDQQENYIIATSIFFALLYFYFAKRTKDPFIDTKLFKSKTFAVTTLASFCSRLGSGGISFLLPILLQINHEFSPLKSSSYIIFYAMGMLTCKFFIQRILKSLGFKKTLIIDAFLLGTTIAGLILVVESTDHLLIVSIIFCQGFFACVLSNAMNVLAYVDLEDDMISKATSIVATVQQLSMSFSVAFIVFLLRMNGSNTTLIGHTAYDLTIATLAIIVLLSCLIFTMLSKRAGENASGHV